MPRKNPAKTVNRAELAAIMDVSPSTIDQWVRKGMPVVTQGARGVAWEFDPQACIKWRDRWKASKSAPAGAAVIDLNDARQRKVTAEARQAELDLAEREGSLIPIEDVASIVAEEYSNVRSRFMALPGEMATELEHLSPAEIQDKLAIAIEDILSELTADEKYSAKHSRRKQPARKPGLSSRRKS